MVSLSVPPPALPGDLSPGRLRLKNRASRMARLADLQVAPLFVILAEFNLIKAALDMMREEDPAAWAEAVRTVEGMRRDRLAEAGETMQ